MSLRLIALLVCAPLVAEAGSHCHEVSHVVGYQRCSRFGWWSFPFGMNWEIGGMAQRFSPGTIDAVSAAKNGPVVHVTSVPGDHTPLTAEGMRFRNAISVGRFLLGAEMDFASLTTGPALIDTAALGGTGTPDHAEGGTLVQAKLVIGFRESLGPVALGFGITPGVRVAMFDTSAMTLPSEIWGLVDVQARGETWLSPHWSLVATVSADALRLGDVGAGLGLGLHLTPYDGIR